MDSLLPADPKARRTAIVVWAAAGALGTAAVWWLASYLDTLSALAQTDRQASMELFRSRVLPALVVVVLVAVVAGGLLLRQGLQIVRAGQLPHAGARDVRDTDVPSGNPARVLGFAAVLVGFLMALLPLVMLTVLLWMIRHA